MNESLDISHDKLSSRIVSLDVSKEREPCSPSPSDAILVGRLMTAPEVVESLHKHGCIDLTPTLSLDKCKKQHTEIGSFGRLYRGVAPGGAQIALKCVQPTFRLNTDQDSIKSAASELLAWSKCFHPNLNQLLGLAHYGPELHPTWTERLRLGAQIADGVAYLHSMGLVHEDLKAINIWVSKSGTPVITEFGHPTVLSHSTEPFNAVASTSSLSIRWTAPELFEGQGRTRMTDVWALGMVLLEIFTGSVPYAKILSDVAPLEDIKKLVLPERPEEHIPTGDAQADLLWSLLNQCWAAGPMDRPTAEEVHDKIREMESLSGSLGDSHCAVINESPAN
ncbi:tyrosine kinase catalytic domain protein, partial [Rhizoctonia solani AG-3 Rhs1AP]